MRVVSFSNLKGGSAKSTTAFNLTGALLEQNQRVLAIDLDPQQTLSLSYLGITEAATPLSQVLLEDGDIAQAIVPGSYEGLAAIPADNGLKGIKSGQVQLEGGELRLRSALQKLHHGIGELKFDWAIIDCPPSLDRLTMNALVAADYVLIPVDAGAGGRRALSDTMDYIASAQKWYNPTLKILGLLINNVNVNTVYDQTTEDAVRQRYQQQVFETVIPASVRIRESAEFQTPTVFCTGSEYKRYAEAYRRLCQEVLARTGAV